MGRGYGGRCPGAAEEAAAKVRGTWETESGTQVCSGCTSKGNGLRLGQVGPRATWPQSCSPAQAPGPRLLHIGLASPQLAQSQVSPLVCWTPPADRSCPGTRCGWGDKAGSTGVGSCWRVQHWEMHSGAQGELGKGSGMLWQRGPEGVGLMLFSQSMGPGLWLGGRRQAGAEGRLEHRLQREKDSAHGWHLKSSSGLLAERSCGLACSLHTPLCKPTYTLVGLRQDPQGEGPGTEPQTGPHPS